MIIHHHQNKFLGPGTDLPEDMGSLIALLSYDTMKLIRSSDNDTTYRALLNKTVII